MPSSRPPYEDGYDELLRQAIRNDPCNDWSIHTIDYKAFKKRLKYFIRRRIQINNMILNSHDQKIPEKVLMDLLGQQQGATSLSSSALVGFDPKGDRTTKNRNIRSTKEKLEGDAIDPEALVKRRNDEDDATAIEDDDASSSFGYVQFVEPSNSSDTVDPDQQIDIHQLHSFDDLPKSSPPHYTSSSKKPNAMNNYGSSTSGKAFPNKSNYKNNNNTKRKGRISIMRRLSICERNEIISFLNHEMDKVVMFYLSQYQYIVCRIEELYDRDRISSIVQNMYDQQHNHHGTTNKCEKQHPQQQQQQIHNEEEGLQQRQQPPLPQPPSSSSSLFTLSSNYEIGNEILELMLFCISNVITIQQVLIRYDAIALRLDSPPLFNYYMKGVLRPTKKNNSKNCTPFRRILHHEELNQLANHVIMELNLTAVVTSSKIPSSATSTTSDAIAPAASAIHTYIEQFQEARHLFQTILCSLRSTADGTTLLPLPYDGTDRRPSLPILSYDNMAPIIVSTVHDMYHSLTQGKARIGLEPADLAIRENQHSLTKQLEQIIQWRYIRRQHPGWYYTDINNIQTSGDDKFTTMKMDPIRHKAQLSSNQIYHLFLCLLSGFLYCMNYYIVEPSSTMYVNRFHAYDAMSGTLIGMMPLAAFLSAIPYSYGTNQSFRYPFLISCCLLILGNIVYSMADISGHLYIAMLGRFLCGLGAPKCIIRRFMADSTPMKLRTSVNALYAMTLGVGSAMGPFMAIILNRFNFTITHGATIITLNGLTLPGYFMASLWLLFFFVLVLTFQEPDRDGLNEQKELEIMNKTASLIISSSVSRDPGGIDTSAMADDDRSTSNNSESNNSAYSVDSNYNFNNSGLLPHELVIYEDTVYYERFGDSIWGKMLYHLDRFISKATLPVLICLGLLFAKVFTIEALVSATSTLTKNRYGWQVQQVGTLGFVNGLIVIPFSIMIGKLSMTYQDHILMKWLVLSGCIGFFLLIDLSDIFYGTPTATYNEGMRFMAVSPTRYVFGYFISYISIQAFEGVIGSALSKVIPTSLASGTFNSGLLATLVDTFGRACGDIFISAMGYISLRQLMNLLFVPGFLIMVACLIVIERCRDLLSV